MTTLHAGRPDTAPHLIDEAIRANGAMRVFWAAALAVLRRRPGPRARPPDAADLPPHLRRDVGLLIEPEAADWRHLIR